MNRRVLAPSAAIALYGWVNGSLAAGVGRLQARLDLSATLVALHLICFAIGLVAAGSRPQIARAIPTPDLIFAGLLLPFLLAPHPAVSLGAGILLGMAGSVSLAAAQHDLASQDQLDTSRALVSANIAAAMTAAAATAVLPILPDTWIGMSVLIPATLATLARRPSNSRPSPAHPADHAPLRRQELPALLTVGIVVAVELTLANQVIAFLRATGATDVADSGPLVLFGGLTLGRIAAVATTERRTRTALLSAITVTSLALLPVWLLTAPPPRLVALAVAGLGIGPLYPLAISVLIKDAVSAHAASFRSTAAIGTALIVAPLLVGGLSDLAGPRVGFGLLFALTAIGHVSARNS